MTPTLILSSFLPYLPTSGTSIYLALPQAWGEGCTPKGGRGFLLTYGINSVNFGEPRCGKSPNPITHLFYLLYHQPETHCEIQLKFILIRLSAYLPPVHSARLSGF